MNTTYIILVMVLFLLVVELQFEDVLQYSPFRKLDPRILLHADAQRTLPRHHLGLLALLLSHLSVGHLDVILTSGLFRDPEVLCPSRDVAGVGANAGENGNHSDG